MTINLFKVLLMRKNTVQTFAAFNQGCRRPDRKRHLELCGYKLIAEFNSEEGKPSELALVHLESKTAMTGKTFHGVYLRDLKSMDGGYGYSLYALCNQ